MLLTLDERETAIAPPMTEKERRGTILVVDDDCEMRGLVSDLLSEEGYTTEAVESGAAAMRRIGISPYDLVISDLKMPGISGLDLLRMIREGSPDQAIILITAFGSVETAIEAMKAGALDYIVKPFKSESLRIVVAKAFERIRLQAEVARLRQAVAREYEFSNIVGRSKPMRAVFDLIRRAADTTVNVLIAGESGTGKEMVARAIHYNGPRRDRPFVAVNCAAIPETLLESELFGHVRGAFTDAKGDKKGLIEEAGGGTLFLDEVGDIPLSLQPKLLRVIQERSVRRVGATRTVPVDIRIVSATHQDLKAEIGNRTFREDLFYRINVLQIDLPPLRARREDIPLLIHTFLGRHAAYRSRIAAGEALTGEVVSLLMNYAWPGNVRELENVIERAVTLARGDRIGMCDLPTHIVQGHDDASVLDRMFKKMASLAQVEEAYIQQVLQWTGGNKMQTAQILGIDRKTLYRRLGEIKDGENPPALPLRFPAVDRC